MIALRSLSLALALISPSAIADDATLKRVLAEFLAGAHDPGVHEDFWADDLVYTSSAGERYGKQAILDRLADRPVRETPRPDYRGEDVEVRIEGRTAVVTFRLVADLPAGSTRSYFNTGVFRYSEGRWRAFAWQATTIAGEADS